MDRFDKLCKHFYEVAEVAAEFEDTSKDLHEILHHFTSDLPTRNATIENVKRSFNGDSNPNNGTEIHSPLRVKCKGRPPSKRKMSAIEKAIKKPSKLTKQSDGRGTNDNNSQRVTNQFDSNIYIEPYVDVVSGGNLLDASTMVVN